MRGTLAISSLLCAGLCGCLSLNWTRSNLNEPTAEAALASLRPGEADLTRCLSVLGAPNLVWEYKIDGVALAYAWVDEAGWGFRVSVPVTESAPSASFSYDSADADRNGVVLMFDGSLTLETVKRGKLGELVPVNRRPAPLPEDMTDR